MSEKANKDKRFLHLYDELKLMGHGKSGLAYLVKHKRKQKLYVAKKVELGGLTNKEIKGAFNEVKVLKSLSHPNVVSYKSCYQDNSTLIIVMEYCDKGDIFSIIEKRKNAQAPFTEAEVMHWFVQICLALKYIHSLKILHRDIKASNIFLSRTHCLKLGDFGISKVLEGTLDAATTVIGTPYYISPEVYQNSPYALQSDVWALGCLLYELCTFRHPFTAENFLLLGYKIVKEPFKPIPDTYSQELANLVTAMLLKSPQTRPTITEILASSIVQKHMAWLIQASCGSVKEVPGESVPPSKEEAKTRTKSEGSPVYKFSSKVETKNISEEPTAGNVCLLKSRGKLSKENLCKENIKGKNLAQKESWEGQEFSSPVVSSKMKSSEATDARVIKSSGWYDIEGELAAAEYPADFEEEEIKEGNIEELLKKNKTIETELRYSLEAFKRIKKQCIRSLGIKLYTQIYNYLKANKRKIKDSSALKEELRLLVGDNKEKMAKAFLISHIIESEGSR